MSIKKIPTLVCFICHQSKIPVWVEVQETGKQPKISIGIECGCGLSYKGGYG